MNTALTSPAAIVADLQSRGLVSQTTKGTEDHLAQARTLYCGFDPTADSLHIGSLVPLLTLRRFQQYGHTPIVLVGGATGMIGDPSFKAQERKLNDLDTIQSWVEKLKKQTSRFVNFEGKNAAKMANNYDWTHGVDVLMFLRDVGKHFTVNNLIAKEAIKSRIEREDSGISYTEFTYPLLQAFDFQQLLQREKCTLQIGGSDQWGNMTAGTELIRKTMQAEAHVLTLPLVTKADGTKFGKTETGTIWLSAEKTSPYAFYQFWLNTADADVEKFLLYFSFKPVEQIKALAAAHAAEPHLRKGQTALAEELTTLVHGTEATAAAQRISTALFGGNIDDLTEADFEQLSLDGLPSGKIRENGHYLPNRVELLSIHALTQTKDINVLENNIAKMFLNDENINPNTVVALLLIGLANSKREARDFIKGNAVQHNGAPVTDENLQLTPENAKFNKYHLLRRGKKNYALLVHA